MSLHYLYLMQRPEGQRVVVDTVPQGWTIVDAVGPMDEGGALARARVLRRYAQGHPGARFSSLGDMWKKLWQERCIELSDSL